jgi:NSS family neurotransmitter:Na+ symporter
VTFILCQPVIFFLNRGLADELHFWGGTFCLVVFATIETILFGWVFGMEKAWTEMHTGSDITIPRIYRFIIKYITPAFLFFILSFWFWQEWTPVILLRDVPAENVPYLIGIRLMLVGLFAVLAFLVWVVWRRKKVRSL